MQSTTQTTTPFINTEGIFRARLVASDRIVSTKEMQIFAADVSQSPVLLGKYLNMLSLLEFVGARALINTFAKQKENNGTNLLHVFEETRHALSLRKMGERLANRTLEYDDEAVFSNLSANYFIKRMIAYVHNDLLTDPELKLDEDKRHRFVINYVSGVLEVRAVWWYTIFNAEITERKYGVNFTKVLADEEGHITSLEDEIRNTDPSYGPRLKKYFVKEEELFARYFAEQRRFLLESTTPT